MLIKLKSHLLIALVFFLLTIGQQYLYFALMKIPIVWLSFGKLVSIYLFLFILSFARNHWIRVILLSFVFLLNYFQMAHLSYFGTQILPSEIGLLFTQSHEIFGTLGAELRHIFIPLVFTLIPLVIGIWTVKKKQHLYTTHIITALFVLYFAYNPIRTYITGNTWGRQPSNRELTGMNVYLSFSYFLGKILPNKILNKRYSLVENESLRLTLTKDKLHWDNVIVVLGESLTPNHMSLFGYKEDTTPYLNSLMREKNFFYARALSSGVSTDIAVAFFLNLGYGDAGAIKAAKGEHCLFRMAKQNDLSTYFYSSQSEQQLRYISPYLCSSYLDEFKGLENIAPDTEDEQAADDHRLLSHLDELLKRPGKKFIMLHQRGSHAPWHLRFSKQAAIMNKNPDQRINHYDNSVVEFDLFWKDLNDILGKTKLKTLVIYISDHGESLGEEGRWGHGFIHPPSFEVPLLIQAFNDELPKGTRQLPINLTQYNVGLYLLQQLGWTPNQSPQSIPNDFVIYGNDIDGFAGKSAVTFGPLNSYKLIPLP